MGINQFNDASLMKEMIADDHDENVRLIAHTKLTAQDSILSEMSELDNEPSTLSEITLKEVIEEEDEDKERSEEVEQSQKPSGLERIQSDTGNENGEAQSRNNVGETEKQADRKVKETNFDEDKPLSPIEKKLSKQELFKNENERPTNTRRNRNTQRDPFHKDRAPRKSVLKRPANPSPRVDTIEATTFSSSPTGKDYDDDEDDESYEKKRQQQMDRKCCVVM